MTNSDDKKDSKTGAQKSSGAKPVKRSRKRQASRPPTINVKAVRLESETTVDNSSKKRDEEKNKPKVSEKKTAGATSKTGSNTADLKTPNHNIADGLRRYGYRDLAVSAGIGAAAAIGVFVVIFGISALTSGQKNVGDEIASLSSRIESLSTLADTAKTNQVNSNAIRTLRQQMDSLAGRPQNAQIGKLEKRVRLIETAIDKPQKPLIGAAELKKLTGRLSTLDVKIGQVQASAEKSIRRSARLEQAVKSAGETIKGSANGTQGSIVAQNLRLADFDSRLKGLSDDLKRLKNRTPENTTILKLEKTIAGLQEDTGKLKDRFASIDKSLGDSARKLTTLKSAIVKSDQRLSRLEQVDRSNDTSRLAVLNFAFEGLVQKIKAGGPFIRQLKIVTTALPQNKRLEKLENLSKSGVKSVTQLQNEFTPVLRKILTAGDAQTSSGMFDRLVVSVKSLIRIRRIGEIKGNDNEAIIARLEARVKAGDLAAALTMAKKLDGTSARTAKVWVQAVEERLKTIELIKNIRNDVISGLESR